MSENKRVETEEEMKKRLREEVIAELEKEKDGKKEKEEKIEEPSKEEMIEELVEDEEPLLPKSSKVVAIVALAIMAVAVFSFPQIHRFIENIRLSRLQERSEKKEEDDKIDLPKITLESKSVQNLTYPVMRNNRFAAESYFTRDSIKISDFHNNDLLFNAFINIGRDVETGEVNHAFLTSFTGTHQGEFCGRPDQRVSFSATFIGSRIANLFTRTVKFNHASFNVPSTFINPNGDARTPYVGRWVFDSRNNMYVFHGRCGPSETGETEFFDIKIPRSAEGTEYNRIIHVTYDMAFARVNVESKQYALFRNPDMTDQIGTGSLTTNNSQKELTEAVQKLLENNVTVYRYRYRFSTINCRYGGDWNYCFESAEWIR